ncbi:hypothetical protein K440DRAFT_636776 [Wilcoxina mikolae CBS 423.85]|nr:hypothetical protein K440DRAFT_636776 [Wilcoxina mikolae CBS 423.85]
MTKWDVTNNGNGIPEVDERRNAFSALISLFKRTSRPDPDLRAMEQALRDTTAAALAVATGVSPNAKPTRATKKVMFNAPPTDSPDPPSPLDNAEKIEDLCLAIHEAVNTDSIGVITAEEGLWWRLCPANPFSPCYIRETISLDSLLERGTLEVRDRLKLGVTLAAATMQLHATKWFGESESWGKRDIFFPQETANFEPAGGGDAVSIRRPIVDNPFVRQVFSTRRQNTTGLANPASLATPIVQYDRSLFSLGIILLELWRGKRLEDLPEYPQSNIQNIDIAQFQTAFHLMDKIREEAGPMYGDAVRRCIRGLDHPKNSLDDKDFKTKVQAMVVTDLERNWKVFIDQESQEP